jgi:hypothetical protein
MPRWSALALVLFAAGCSGGPGSGPIIDDPADLRLPVEAPDIIGTVTRASESGGTRVLLVEQVPERSAGYPIASVYVRADSRVLRQQDGRTARARRDELGVGTPVRVWFSGPVRESYPVQADAGVVLIER